VLSFEKTTGTRGKWKLPFMAELRKSIKFPHTNNDKKEVESALHGEIKELMAVLVSFINYGVNGR
jgi:hypothetical protein